MIDRINRLNNSWDMNLPGGRNNQKRNQSQGQFLGQMVFPLVKEQMLIRRSIFTSNYRSDPIFTLRAIGNTPEENAVNMQDLLESNNEQTRFKQLFLRPSIDMMIKWGASVCYTEYSEDHMLGWRTIADPVMGSQRVYGPVKNTKNALNHLIDIRNYFQDPLVVNNNYSSYRGHIERQPLSWLTSRYAAHPELYIKENVEAVIKQVKDKHFTREKNYTDPQGRQSQNDYGRVMVNDIIRGQFKFELEGNEGDGTYYYVEMIGDKIIRFQDNPYDMNMNQYTVLTCEPRYDFWWGNTPAEYSIQTENSLNLLGGLSIENALEGMKKYIFFNKNAIDQRTFQHAASNSRIPVDVTKDVNLNNVLYSYQTPDTSSRGIDGAYARILENNQRMTTTPDLNRPPSQGGPSNKTAYAADVMTKVGGTQDADILENYSDCLTYVGQNNIIVLAQFLGNWGPIMIRPTQRQSIRQVQKANITGNYSLYLDTALQKSYQGEMSRYQNTVTWLLNLVNSGLPIQPKFETLVKQVLKMGEIMNVDEILPEAEALPGTVPTQVQPGQELAGAAQEVQPQAEIV